MFLSACLVVKSGCEFRNFTAVDVFFTKGSREVDVCLTRYDITGMTTVDPVMKTIVQGYMDQLEHSLDQSIGIVGVSKTSIYSLSSQMIRKMT